ncbi:MAG: hypothetical protein K2F80_07340, partial [Muribaculaceae bacterium]|nr:hypothetical protein [Muribaculaceae bacterium]
ALGTVSFACSNDKDDDPTTETGIKGVWVDPDDPMGTDGSSILITDNCWIWDNYYEFGTLGLVQYLNASYETLIKHFEPDYDFNIYRYDKQNDFYLLYSWIKDENGKQLFECEPIILKVRLSDKQLQYKWYEYYDDYYNDGEELITRDEILKNNKYATIDENVKLHSDDNWETFVRHQ